MVTGCHVWISVVTIGLRENVFSVSYEMSLLKRFLRSGQCVFFVRYELRLDNQFRTALFCVTMQHVVVISYQRFGTTDCSHRVFWILDS